MVTVSKEPKKVTKEAVKKPAEEPLGEYELVKKTIALIDKYARNRHLMVKFVCFCFLWKILWISCQQMRKPARILVSQLISLIIFSMPTDYWPHFFFGGPEM